MSADNTSNTSETTGNSKLAVTAAYQNAPARDISVFDYSQVVYAAIFGAILFGEVPDVWRQDSPAHSL